MPLGEVIISMSTDTRHFRGMPSQSASRPRWLELYSMWRLLETVCCWRYLLHFTECALLSLRRNLWPEFWQFLVFPSFTGNILNDRIWSNFYFCIINWTPQSQISGPFPIVYILSTKLNLTLILLVLTLIIVCSYVLLNFI